MQLLGTKGQKFLYCPTTKGQWDKLKILPRDKARTAYQNLGRDVGQEGTRSLVLSRTVLRDKTEQRRKELSETGKGHFKTEKGCSKTEKDSLKQERMF